MPRPDESTAPRRRCIRPPFTIADAREIVQAMVKLAAKGDRLAKRLVEQYGDLLED